MKGKTAHKLDNCWFPETRFNREQIIFVSRLTGYHSLQRKKLHIEFWLSSGSSVVRGKQYPLYFFRIKRRLWPAS